LSSFDKIKTVKRAYKNLLDLGATLTDTLDERAAKRLFVLATLTGSALTLLIGLSLLRAGQNLAGGICLGWTAWHGLVLIALKRLRRIQERMITAHLALTIVAVAILGYLLGDFTQSGLLIYALTVPALALILLPNRARALALFYAVVALGSLIVQPGQAMVSSLPDGLFSFLFVASLFATANIGYYLITFVFAQRDRIRQHLKEEQTKTDRLLNSIFPAKVAAQVKNSLLDESTVPMIAEQFNEASVLFADMVNFTSMSSRMSPRELVNMLSAVFSHFDRLAEKRGLEKIKTVGDCYIVAAGLPQPRADHAQALAELALEIQAFTKTYYFSVYKINFRIGIHSGPLIAGVIGQKKISYDLWGDTVNIASRMSSRAPGAGIQITHQTYELLKDEFVCIPRGKVFVKGKGDMETWLLTGKRDS
jgi:adenylate cyclase